MTAKKETKQIEQLAEFMDRCMLASVCYSLSSVPYLTALSYSSTKHNDAYQYNN